MAIMVAYRDGFDAARPELEAIAKQREAWIESEPGNAPIRGRLGLTYARLGDGDAAVREGRLAVDLTARDRWAGPKVEELLAQIYAALGRADDALDLVDKLLETTYADSITLADLRLDPAWDPIRDNERFRALVGEQ